jgi:hypothetical protein
MAIKILDWWINQKKQGMEKLEKEWDYSKDGLSVGKTLFEMDKTIIVNLEKLRKELVPNCKHPKKMRDRIGDDQWYCMNCNVDL